MQRNDPNRAGRFIFWAAFLFPPGTSVRRCWRCPIDRGGWVFISERDIEAGDTKTLPARLVLRSVEAETETITRAMKVVEDIALESGNESARLNAARYLLATLDPESYSERQSRRIGHAGGVEVSPAREPVTIRLVSPDGKVKAFRKPGEPPTAA